MSNLITITTDFGDQFAASQLRAVIAALGFKGQVIENHSVTHFSVTEGAFQINQIAKFSPPCSIHLGVIDPGVGSDRWGVVIKTKRSWFVGPNNGLLYPSAKEEGIKGIWWIKESAFGEKISNTFHGRDIFIKAAVYLAKGKSPKSFGCIKVTESDLEKREFQEGEIIHIDTYGNYKIHWPYKLTLGKTILVKNGHKKPFKIPVVRTFDDVKPNQPLAFLGSHGTLEIAINLESARNFFRFALGERLAIKQI